MRVVVRRPDARFLSIILPVISASTTYGVHFVSAHVTFARLPPYALVLKMQNIAP